MLIRIILGGWVLSLCWQVSCLAMARAKVIDELDAACGLIGLPIISQFLIQYCWILSIGAIGAALMYLVMIVKDINVKYVIIYIAFLFVLSFVSAGLAIGGLLPLVRLPL